MRINMSNYMKTAIFLLATLFCTASCTEVEMKQLSRQLLTGMSSGGSTSLTLADLDAGLKEALRIGSERVVRQVGRLDGFNRDLDIHIPLPRDLEKARTIVNLNTGQD